MIRQKRLQNPLYIKYERKRKSINIHKYKKILRQMKSGARYLQRFVLYFCSECNVGYPPFFATQKAG